MTNPPDVKPTSSGVLAAPILAPPLGPSAASIGAQMPMPGLAAPNMKPNVLAPPNTSSSGLSPLPLSHYSPTPPPAAMSTAATTQPATPTEPLTPSYSMANLEPIAPDASAHSTQHQPAQGKGRRKSAAPKQEAPVEPEPEPPLEGNGDSKLHHPPELQRRGHQR